MLQVLMLDSKIFYKKTKHKSWNDHGYIKIIDGMIKGETEYKNFDGRNIYNVHMKNLQLT